MLRKILTSSGPIGLGLVIIAAMATSAAAQGRAGHAGSRGANFSRGLMRGGVSSGRSAPQRAGARADQGQPRRELGTGHHRGDGHRHGRRQRDNAGAGVGVYLGPGFGVGYPDYGYAPYYVGPGRAYYYETPRYNRYGYAYDAVPTDYTNGQVPPTTTAPAAATPPASASPPTVAPPLVNASDSAAGFQWQAEQAFREHRYQDAQRLSRHAVIEDAPNGQLHLFAAQVAFALGQYGDAVDSLRRGTARLDSSQWGFVVKNFKQIYRGQDYVTQMKQLVDYVDQHPDAADAILLRGYHYRYLGYDDAADRQLGRVLELRPDDELAIALMASTPPPEPTLSSDSN